MMFFLTKAFLVCFVGYGAAVKFDTKNIGRNNLKGEYLKLSSRTYIPYGPDLAREPRQAATDQPWEGFGYGFGATEHWAYDTKHKYIYSQSEAGEYIAVVDFETQPGTVTEYSLDLTSYDSDIRDITICSERGILFISLSDYNKVIMFRAIDRSNPGIPEVIKEIDAGNSPDALKLSDDCKYLAVANQNEAQSLLDGAGSVHIVSNFQEDDSSAVPDVRTVSFSGFTDTQLLNAQVHMPLTRNAMRYWNQISGVITENSVWDELIANYDPAIAMDPEFMAFSHDHSRLYVNLQDNSALLVVNPENGEVLNIEGYGLKPMTATTGLGKGVDLLEEGGCSRLTSTGSFLINSCLFLGRTPDGIATVEVDGINYVITAEEGSDFDLGEFEENYDAEDVLNGTSFAFPGFKADPSFFDPNNVNNGCSANFNKDCNEVTVAGGWCASGFELTIGSSAVNYETDFTQPEMSRIVGFGGRGIGIFRVASTGAVTEIWDSGSEFEVQTCRDFPWAHNAIQDEEFVTPDDPAYKVFTENQEDYDAKNDPGDEGCDDRGDGQAGPCPMKDTVGEQSLSDGPAVEAVAVGVACDRLVMVGCGENNGMCLLYDISSITDPKLLKVFNLSPASENLSPTLAYNEKTLGDIDSETILFLDHTVSPTGKTAIMFGGAISGTISLYEFECEFSETSESSDDLEAGAIAGIVIGCVFGVVLVGVLCVLMSGRRASGVDKSTTEPVSETEMASQNQMNSATTDVNSA